MRIYGLLIALLYVALCKNMAEHYYMRLLGVKYADKKYKFVFPRKFIDAVGIGIFFINGFYFNPYYVENYISAMDFDKKYKYVLAMFGGFVFFALSAAMFFTLQYFIIDGIFHEIFYALAYVNIYSFVLNLLPFPCFEGFRIYKFFAPKNSLIKLLQKDGNKFIYAVMVCSIMTIFFKNGEHYNALSILLKGLIGF
ncbi:MAG: hypothetical protein LBQ27_03710 [Clostridiales bacterium]|jgi:Zn-dependent protease|nr:hypothetical protein [Clostridiales bacterium]